jgi:hypothetical protein
MKPLVFGRAAKPAGNKPMSKDTLTFLSMKPGESVTIPITEICNARAKLSKLKREGKGSWFTRIDKEGGVVRVVRI